MSLSVSKNENDYYDKKTLDVAEHVIVEWVPWILPDELSSLIYYHGQTIAINECIYRLLYLVDFIVGTDLDEFIVPTSTDDWSQMLEKLPCKQQSVASYSFRNQFVRTSWTESERYNSTSSYVTSVVRKSSFRTLTFSNGDGSLLSWKERSKIIARPDRVLLWHVHEILDSSIINRTTHVNCYVNGTDAILYHYRAGVERSSTAAVVDVKRLVKHFRSSVLRRLDDGMKTCLGH